MDLLQLVADGGSVEPVIETVHLNKRFGRTHAVRGLDVQVRPATIYGLIGPNGAGKSTTLNMVMGLLRPDSGYVQLFGQAWSRKQLRNIGASINGPSFYPHLSGRANLRVHAALLGLKDAQVDEALDVAGLTQSSRRKARNYSVGMKNRLALAIALLGDPPILILDEPQNGLDPAGVRELRQLMERLRASGRTVVFSSHILTEVAHVADDIGVIVGGRLVFQGTLGQFAPNGDLERSYFDYCGQAVA